jgi:hypothetical protein
MYSARLGAYDLVECLGAGIGGGGLLFAASASAPAVVFVLTRKPQTALMVWTVVIFLGFAVLGIGSAREARAVEERSKLYPPSVRSSPCEPFNPPPYDGTTYEDLLAQMCGDRTPLKVQAATVLREFDENPIRTSRTYRWRFIQLSGRVESIDQGPDSVATLGWSVKYAADSLPGRITARFLPHRQAPLVAVKRGQAIDLGCWLAAVQARSLDLRNCELLPAASLPIDER